MFTSSLKKKYQKCAMLDYRSNKLNDDKNSYVILNKKIRDINSKLEKNDITNWKEDLKELKKLQLKIRLCNEYPNKYPITKAHLMLFPHDLYKRIDDGDDEEYPEGFIEYYNKIVDSWEDLHIKLIDKIVKNDKYKEEEYNDIAFKDDGIYIARDINVSYFKKKKEEKMHLNMMIKKKAAAEEAQKAKEKAKKKAAEAAEAVAKEKKAAQNCKLILEKYSSNQKGGNYNNMDTNKRLSFITTSLVILSGVAISLLNQ